MRLRRVSGRNTCCFQPHLHFADAVWDQPEHPQNVFYSLEASRSVSEDVECKLRCVNFRRVSDPRRPFQLAFGVSGISDDYYRSTMGVIVISLGTAGSADDKAGSTCKRWQQAWEHLESL